MPQRHIGCLHQGEVIRAANGRRQLRAWAIHPGLGVSGLRLQDPGWGHGLNLPKTEVFEEFFVTS